MNSIRNAMVWCEMVAIKCAIGMCASNKNFICTISSNYLDGCECMLSRRLQFNGLFSTIWSVWALYNMCTCCCCWWYIAMWGRRAEEANVQTHRSVCVCVLCMYWWRTLWSSHYMCYNCRFTIGLSQPIQCVCPHSTYTRHMERAGESERVRERTWKKNACTVVS